MSRAFWLAAAIFAIVMIGTTLPTPIYPLYERQFGIPPVLIPVIFSAYAVAVGAGLAFFGRLSDEAGRRPVLFAGLLLSGLSAIVFMLAHGLGALLAGRVLSGLSAGIFTGTATAAMIELAPEARRRAAAGIAVAANIGGLGLGTLLSGALASAAPLPLRLPYAVDVVLVALAGAAMLGVPETAAMRETARSRGPALVVPAEIRATFWNAAVAGACAFAVSGLFGAIVPSFLAQRLHQPDPLLAGIVVFTLFAFTAAGQVGMRNVEHDRALAIGCAVLVGGTAILAAAVVWNSLALTLAAAAVEGAGQGLAMAAGLAAINEGTGDRRGQVSSTYFLVLYAGLAFPVIGVGLLAQARNLQDASLAFCAAVAIAAGAVLVRLVRGPSASA